MFNNSRLIGTNALISSAKKILNARLTRNTSKLQVSANSSSSTYPFMSFTTPIPTRTTRPPPHRTTTRMSMSQCTTVATIGCGIISPNCEAQFANLRSKSTRAIRNSHTVTKKVLKSLTNALERTAVKSVTRTP